MMPGALVAIHGQRLPSLFQHHIQVLGTLFVPPWHQYLRRLHALLCKYPKTLPRLPPKSLGARHALRCKQLPLLTDFKEGFQFKRLPLVDLWVPNYFINSPRTLLLHPVLLVRN